MPGTEASLSNRYEFMDGRKQDLKYRLSLLYHSCNIPVTDDNTKDIISSIKP